MLTFSSIVVILVSIQGSQCRQLSESSLEGTYDDSDTGSMPVSRAVDPRILPPATLTSIFNLFLTWLRSVGSLPSLSSGVFGTSWLQSALSSLSQGYSTPKSPSVVASFRPNGRPLASPPVQPQQISGSPQGNISAEAQPNNNRPPGGWGTQMINPSINNISQLLGTS